MSFWHKSEIESVQKTTIEIDAIKFSERTPLGYYGHKTAATDIAFAIVDRIREQKDELDKAHIRLAEQERIIIALKAEIGNMILQREEMAKNEQ